MTRVLCDKCNMIMDEKEKRRLMLWYPIPPFGVKRDIEYILCDVCAEIARKQMQIFMEQNL